MKREIVFTDDNHKELKMSADKPALTIELDGNEFDIGKRSDVGILIEELQYLQEKLEK